MKKYLFLLLLAVCAIKINAQPDTWIQKPDFAGQGRQEAVGFGIGNKGYIATGEVDVYDYRRDLWEYDPATEIWTRKADLPGMWRGEAVGFSIGNKGYVGTGINGDLLDFLKDFWEYDPSTNSWTQKADFGGSARIAAVGFSIGDKGYLGLGSAGTDFWEYDPAFDTWTRKADFPGTSRRDAIGFGIRTKGYVGMGAGNADFWEYDPATDKWTRMKDFPGTPGNTPTVFSIGDKGYCLPGSSSREFWEYEPLTDTWTRRANVGSPFVLNAAGFSAAGKGYIGTGYYDVSDFWEYTPALLAPAVPVISSISPLKGAIGSTVTINGSGFSTTPVNNTVYFGAVKTVVTASTSTSLQVTAPVGATYQPLTVTVNGLTAYADQPFVVTFPGSSNNFDSTSFEARKDIDVGVDPLQVYEADIDGDGKSDLITITDDFTTSGIFILRNTSTPGSVSFADKIPIGSFNEPRGVATGDFDGDGKTDLAFISWPGTLSVFRNTSSPGSISFGPQINYGAVYGGAAIAVSDIDMDGKPDIVTSSYNAQNTGIVSVFKNTTTGGAISFAQKIDYPTGDSPFTLSTADFDGDNKYDLATVGNNISSKMSAFLNTSKPDTISFAAKQDFTVGSLPRGGAAGDLDDDQKPDYISANQFSFSISVLRNTSTVSNISFAPKTDFTIGAFGVQPYNVAIGDINGDGRPDIAASVVTSAEVTLLKNNSSTGVISFSPHVEYATGITPNWVSIGDLDGDGKPDLAVSNQGSQNISIFRNTISEKTVCNDPSNLAVINITGTSARLTWDLPNPPVAFLEIRYRASGTSKWFYHKRDGTKNSITLYGLTSNTTYQWQVKCNCDDVVSHGVAGPAFTTKAGFAPAVTAASSDAAAYRSNIFVAPTPATNIAIVTFNGQMAGSYILEIKDVAGKTILRRTGTSFTGENRVTLDLASVRSGTYFITVTSNNDKARTVKLIKE